MTLHWQLTAPYQEIQVHRVILSACSSFFRNLLRRLPHHHPYVYLRGIKLSELQSIVNFVYNGEVNVAQDDLNSFLSLAEDLKIKGLTQCQGRNWHKYFSIDKQAL